MMGDEAAATRALEELYAQASKMVATSEAYLRQVRSPLLSLPLFLSFSSPSSPSPPAARQQVVIFCVRTRF
jgi:hypothetical protein